MARRKEPYQKNCIVCEQPFEAWSSLAVYCGGLCRGRDWVKKNPERQHERRTRWTAENRERVRELDRAQKMRLKDTDPDRYYLNAWRSNLAKQGITPEQYQAMEALQNGVCASCGRPETAKSRFTGTKKLSVDHDHRTGEVRGLLDVNCNAILGHADDDPNMLFATLDYLLSYKNLLQELMN